MAKYHINGEGNPGACRAKPGNCPFGSESDHYADAKEARKIYERQQELLADIGVGGGPALNPATELALTAPLEPLPKQPRWIKGLTSRLQQELFGVTPQVIATVDSPLGPLAVVWEAATAEPQDLASEIEDGFRVSRITYRSLKDGELVGYLKATSMSAASVNESYGSDEWRGFRYARSRDSFYAMEDIGDSDWGSSDPNQSAASLKRLSIEPPELDTREKLVEFVNSAQQHLRSYADKLPMSMEDNELRTELSRLQGESSKRLDAYSASFAEPFIDYIKLDHPQLRGRGLGASLYVFMARKQAEQGLSLRASGLQTPEAEKSWKRMAADSRFPVKVSNNVYETRGNRTVSTGYSLDFRESA